MKRAGLPCLLFAAWMLLFCSCGSNPVIGLIDGINFGMPPSEVTKQLGEPVAVREISEYDSSFYSYMIQLDDEKPTVTFTFIDDKIMSSVLAIAVCDSQESARTLFDKWKDKEIAAFENEKGYYCEDPIQTPEGEYRIKLGTSQGAGGISVDISVKGTNVVFQIDYMD